MADTPKPQFPTKREFKQKLGSYKKPAEELLKYIFELEGEIEVYKAKIELQEKQMEKLLKAAERLRRRPDRPALPTAGHSKK